MKHFILFTLLAALGVGVSTSRAVEPGTSYFEMRVYYSPEGKLNDLHARFRNHTLRLFEKHGITNVAYFTPEGANPENKLVFFLSYPSREAREKSWHAFQSDPDWKEARQESERNGTLVRKVDQVFFIPVDYSPALKIGNRGGRIFEMRTYATPEGKLANLNARFRDHTIRLFEKHGMENIIYWTKAPGQDGVETTLVYLLAHKDRDAARKSFAAFGQDPDWRKAAAESQRDGSLTVRNGIQSEFLVPTDYSPLK